MKLPGVHEFYQGETDPAAPAAGYAALYFVGGELRAKLPNGAVLALAGSIVGSQAIAAGAEEVVINFPVGTFSVRPSNLGTPLVEKGGADDPNIWVVSVHSVSAAGMTVVLSAPAPTANYQIHWNAHP